MFRLAVRDYNIHSFWCQNAIYLRKHFLNICHRTFAALFEILYYIIFFFLNFFFEFFFEFFFFFTKTESKVALSITQSKVPSGNSMALMSISRSAL